MKAKFVYEFINESVNKEELLNSFKGPGYYIFLEDDYDFNSAIRVFNFTNSSEYKSVSKSLLKGQYEPIDDEYYAPEWYRMLKLKENKKGIITTSKQSSSSFSNFTEIFNHHKGIVGEIELSQEEILVQNLLSKNNFSDIIVEKGYNNRLNGTFKYKKTKWSFTLHDKNIEFSLWIDQIKRGLKEKTIVVIEDTIEKVFQLAMEALKKENWSDYEGFYDSQFSTDLWLGNHIKAKNIKKIEEIFKHKTNEEKINQLVISMSDSSDRSQKVIKGILNTGVDFSVLTEKNRIDHQAFIYGRYTKENVELLINAGAPISKKTMDYIGINEAMGDVLKPVDIKELSKKFFKGSGLYVTCTYETSSGISDRHQFTSFEIINNDNQLKDFLEDTALSRSGSSFLLKFSPRKKNEILFSREGDFDINGFDQIN